MSSDAQLTTTGLQLVLNTVREKWSKQGAKFLKDLQVTSTSITAVFLFDGALYEVTLHADTTLTLMELDGDQQREITLPPGLTFPKGLKRSHGYDKLR